MLSKEGLSCEVINLRTIRPLDRDTIIQSVMRTGRLVTVEDGYPFSGIGAELIAMVDETGAFDSLLAPVQRVTSFDIPIPYAKRYKQATVPNTEAIAKAVRKAMAYQ